MPAITVGQVGLGTMGKNVALRLLEEDFDVIGFDIDDEPLRELADAGGRTASSNAEVGREADIVLSALNYPEIVEAAYLGPDGVLEGADGSTICIEQSTIPPGPIRELAPEFQARNVGLLDAPFLSGGPNFARSGTMVLPVGGAQDLYEDEDVQAVLSALSRERHHVGELGTGKTTKLVSNMMALGNLALGLEALSYGVAQGMDARTLWETLAYSAGSSVMFRVVLPAALNREFDSGFPVKSTQKDLRFARRSAEAVDFPIPITSAIHEFYTMAAGMGFADENSPAAVKVFEAFLEETLALDEPVDIDYDDPIAG